MRHEKIIKRENGDRILISVSLFVDYSGASYNLDRVSKCQKGKRNFIAFHSSDDYQWRSLNREQREEYELEIYLRHVTEAEILEAKIELWNKLKPTK